MADILSLASLGLPSLAKMQERINHPDLDGSKARNRVDPSLCQIRACNDYEAVLCWLNEYQHKTTTYRTYQKEAERFLLWCICQHNKALSDMDREDFEVYFRFLDDPQPQEKWCAPKGRKAERGSLHWRPFEGPLSRIAKNNAITIINSLINYLVYARYLSFNPLGLMKNKGRKQIDSEQQRLQIWTRILEMDEWEAMLDTLETLPDHTEDEKDEKTRLRFLVIILFMLGLRIHELESHTWGAFQELQGAWWFFVQGKGDKKAKIPVNQELLQAIKAYRIHCRLQELPEAGEDRPIIQSLRTGKPIGARHMNRLLKELAWKTAEKFKDRPPKAEKLKRFSPHWLRHLSATMQDRAGIQFKHIQANHRHESEETTRRYVHAFDNERHQDMQKLRLRQMAVGWRPKYEFLET